LKSTSGALRGCVVAAPPHFGFLGDDFAIDGDVMELSEQEQQLIKILRMGCR